MIAAIIVFAIFCVVVFIGGGTSKVMTPGVYIFIAIAGIAVFYYVCGGHVPALSIN